MQLLIILNNVWSITGGLALNIGGDKVNNPLI